MKRVLLALILLTFAKVSFSQLAINEVYLQPNCGTLGVTASDYIELYNGTGVDINLDCYKIVVYYKQAKNDGGNVYAYVFDLPSKIIKESGLFVFSGLDHFCVQGGGTKSLDLTPSGNGYNWNSIPLNSPDASLRRYIYVADNDPNTPGNQSVWNEDLTFNSNTQDVFDLLAISNNTQAIYNIFLYSSKVESGNDKAINSLLFGYNSTYPPLDVTSLPPLPQTTLGGDCTSNGIIDFSQIISNEQVTSASGTDNGYYREFNGLCGTWKKAASPTDHTPGANNSLTIPTTGAGTFDLTTEPILCNGSSPYSITVKVANSEGSPYPITYIIYKDEYPYASPTNPSLSTADNKISEGTYDNADNKNSFIVNNLLPGESYLIQGINAAGCFSTFLAIPSKSCAPLPVHFSAFNAQRNKQNVSLKWETATEQNNRGFNVQRNTKGVWENIAWVFSAAEGGNSSNLLTYTYKDINNERGVSQYRIQQVDFDAKASYSVIRSVRGEEQAVKTVVYPNPSMDGKVNVVFEDQSAKAVTVSDISGRVVRQYRNVLNNVQIEGLESGMYSIQVTDLSSAVSTTEKVIIKKR